MSHEFIKTEIIGRILLVTMSRPDVLNAIHAPMCQEMARVWDDYAANPDLYVAVLTGAGDRAFSVGNDLKYTAQGNRGGMPASGFAGLCSRFDLDKPVIAAVDGFALGGGFETALTCDMIIASDASKFGLPEVKVGLFAGAGGIQRLSRQIGRKPATEIMLTGRHVSAEEGYRLGFVNEVVAHGKALERAMALAKEIAGVSPSSVRVTKRILNFMERHGGLSEGMEYSHQQLNELRETEDFAEGIKAFVEKRAPIWKNR